ncbi:MAG: gliding motility-associated ABC transporter ATP-binding subunit GldA [Cyclobacteriaceae bacterium]
MSVSILNLTKVFGTQTAVDDVSFEASSGVITGFLGPNGAGKSTTMKMATGFLRPTSGDVLVDGVSVVSCPLEVKRMIGYLPEHNPMYLDMYVREFLSFIGRSYGLSSVKDRVEEMIALVGLQKESGKKIGTLSKGYRQRVGMAKALIHDPKVLILDEPTSGLDPNQILEIRRVIKDMSKDKTVILSTHIMQEVESICDQVVIIDSGQVVANDNISSLRQSVADSNTMVVTFETKIDTKLFEAEGLVVVGMENNSYHISSERQDLRNEILRITSANDLPLISLNKSEQSLEQVFRQLTGNKK